MKDKLIKIIKRRKWTILLQVVLLLINVYLLTYPAKIVGNIIDLLYDIEKNNGQILLNTYYLIGFCLLLLIVRMWWKFYDSYNQRHVEKDLKDALFKRVMKIKLSKLQNIKNGELMAYFVKDVNEIRRAVYTCISHGTRIVGTLVITAIVMAKNVDIRLTLATLCPIIITAFIIVKLKNYVEICFRKSQQYFTELSEYVQESTDSIRTTKAYSCEGEQLKKFIRKNRKVKTSNISTEIYSSLIKTSINICFGICYGISILYGSKLVLNGDISIGDFVAFNGYIGLFVGPVSWIPPVISKIKRAQISYKRLDGVFELEREKINIKPRDHIQNTLRGNIKINNLTYKYPGFMDRVLNNINIDIKQGETLGIIGTLGSGKSTLMNLLLRLYQVERGKIIIDGRDINDIPIEELRNNICYITQDNFLFSTTLRENIRLFKDNFRDDDIKESTRNAMIYDDIKNMPNGIETVIGERGVDLSGGQKQRIVISRAFLKASNIIIFDDTFSALDNKTEEKVLENVRHLTQGKTCIIISNRISDIKNSDKIIVLEKGNIKEQGTHKELLETKGLYYEFFMQQSSKTEESLLA